MVHMWPKPTFPEAKASSGLWSWQRNWNAFKKYFLYKGKNIAWKGNYYAVIVKNRTAHLLSSSVVWPKKWREVDQNGIKKSAGDRELDGALKCKWNKVAWFKVNANVSRRFSQQPNDSMVCWREEESKAGWINLFTSRPFCTALRLTVC